MKTNSTIVELFQFVLQIARKICDTSQAIGEDCDWTYDNVEHIIIELSNGKSKRFDLPHNADSDSDTDKISALLNGIVNLASSTHLSDDKPHIYKVVVKYNNIENPVDHRFSKSEADAAKTLFTQLLDMHDNSKFDINVLFKDGTDEYTTDGFLADAKSILKGNGSEGALLAAKKWTTARNEFLPEFFGNSNSSITFFPSKDRVLKYLDSHYTLLRELIVFAKAGGFAFYDGQTQRFLNAVINAEYMYDDDKIIVPLYSPVILNSLHHVTRFVSHYMGLSDENTDIASKMSEFSSSNAAIDLAFDKLTAARINEHFKLSSFFRGTEYFIEAAGGNFVGKQKRWNDSVKPINAVRLLEKIVTFGDERKLTTGKALIVGTVNEEDLAKLKKLLSKNSETIWIIDTWTDTRDSELSWAEYWEHKVDDYNLIFVLDCYGLYENSQTNLKCAFGSMEDSLARTSVHSDNIYEIATKVYFEPKFNLYMNSVDYVTGIFNGINEQRQPFTRKRVLLSKALQKVSQYLETPSAYAERIFFFVSGISDDSELDNYISSNIEVCRKEMYETDPVWILQAVNPNMLRLEMESLFTDGDRSIVVSAWSIAKSVCSDVVTWFSSYLSAENEDIEELKLVKLLQDTYAVINYEGTGDGKLNVRYSVHSDDIITHPEIVRIVKEFLTKFIELASVHEWETLFQNDPLVRGFLHCAFQSVFLACLQGRAKNNDDLLFIYRWNLAPYLLVWQKEDGLCTHDFNEPPNVKASTKYYVTSVLHQLDRPLYNSESEVYARQMVNKAFNTGSLFSDNDVAVYRNIVRKIRQSCENLNWEKSYIYRNAWAAEKE